MVQGLFSPRGAPFPLRPATFVGPWVLRSRPYHPRLVGAPLGRARLVYPQGGPGFLRVYYPNFFWKSRTRVRLTLLAHTSTDSLRTSRRQTYYHYW